MLILFLLTAVASAEDWTRFRGPNGSGIAAGDRYPIEFGKDRNLVWRSPVRPGKSSPVLTGRHVFLTASEDGRLYTQCFDRESGKLLWERGIDRTRDEIANRLNHAAAITPVTDGENIYAFFKDYGLLAYDAQGKLRWKAPLGPFTSNMGLGASPILAGGYVIIVADQAEDSFIAAFDKNNGEMRWRTPRDETEAWGTPLFYHPAKQTPRILTAGRGQFGAYLPATGKRTATLHGLPTTVVGSPVIDGENLFVQGYGSESPAPFSQRLEKLDKNRDGKLSADEYGTEPFLAGIARFKGNRDLVITEDEWNEKQREVLGPNCLVAYRLESAAGIIKPRELWRYDRSFTAVIPSPIVYRGVVYFVKNGGILTSLDAATGKVLKTGRLTGAIAGYSSSPVAAAGNLYIASEDGNVAVIRAAGEWEVINVNDLGEPCYATPALSQGNIYLRTDEALYRFAQR